MRAEIERDRPPDAACAAGDEDDGSIGHSYNAAMQTSEPDSVSAALAGHIARVIDQAGGWIGFERFMELALYAPGLGYYANAGRKFGMMPASGSDFVTAPELSAQYGLAFARQVLQAMDELGRYFNGEGAGAFRTRLAPHGTPFQQAVWHALLRIAPGCTRSYGELALDLHAPTAARAVGAAVGRNPMSILVPCHRVLGGNGSLTGAQALADPSEAGDSAPLVVGVPASIDNDLGLTGLAMILTNVSVNTLLQTEAPDALRGRVMGFYSFVVLGMAPFGALQMGWLADHLGIRVAFAIGGGVCLAVSALVAWRMHGVPHGRHKEAA